jgi:hypothetical protein
MVVGTAPDRSWFQTSLVGEAWDVAGDLDVDGLGCDAARAAGS